MAEASGIRVADLLPERLALARTMQEEAGTGAEVRAARFHWGFIGDQAEAALRGVLDCDVVELLAAAWTKARALQDYADPARHPSGETAIVHLGKHEFARDLHPALEVTLGSLGPYRFEFTVCLAAHVDSVALSIRDGHITGGSAGEGWVSAQLKYGSVPLTKDKDSRKLALPGTFRFAGKGLKIPTAASAATPPAASGPAPERSN